MFATLATEGLREGIAKEPRIETIGRGRGGRFGKCDKTGKTDEPQSKISSKTWPFTGIDTVEEGNGITAVMECNREQPAISAIRLPAFVVEWF